jgi:hypothetical protein
MAGPKNINWDEQPLGEMSDRDLAKKIGVHPSLVSRIRKKRNIQVYARINWDKQPLGLITDSELGEKLGVTRQQVCWARRRRNIEYFNNKIVLSKIQKNEIEGKTAKYIAKKYNINVHTAREYARRNGIKLKLERRKNIDWDKEPLGNVPDNEICKKLNCSDSQVCRARKRRGIKRSPFLKAKCPVCNEVFTKKSPNQIRCSRKCCIDQWNYKQRVMNDEQLLEIFSSLADLNRAIKRKKQCNKAQKPGGSNE